jgi:lactobin A/cerein 7B family class IIb bacteriocin
METDMRNVQETNEMRELTVEEIEHVTGGIIDLGTFGSVVIGGSIGIAICTIVDGLLGWLFD